MVSPESFWISEGLQHTTERPHQHTQGSTIQEMQKHPHPAQLLENAGSATILPQADIKNSLVSNTLMKEAYLTDQVDKHNITFKIGTDVQCHIKHYNCISD